MPKAILHDREGRPIATVAIANAFPPADVLVWDETLFVRYPAAQDAHVERPIYRPAYVEQVEEVDA